MRVSHERNNTLISRLNDSQASNMKQKLETLASLKSENSTTQEPAVLKLGVLEEAHATGYTRRDFRKRLTNLNHEEVPNELRPKPHRCCPVVADLPHCIEPPQNEDEPRIPDINGDGEVGEWDLKFLINDWGKEESKADFNEDGIVNITDLNHLLANWGKVPQPEPEPQPEPNPDIDGDGIVSEKDVRYVIKHWDQSDTRFDFNQDGDVNFFDLSHMLNLFAEQHQEREG